MLQMLERGMLLHLLHLPSLAVLQVMLQVPCQPPLHLLLLLQTAAVCPAVLLPLKLLPRLLLLPLPLPLLLLPGLVGV